MTAERNNAAPHRREFKRLEEQSRALEAAQVETMGTSAEKSPFGLIVAAAHGESKYSLPPAIDLVDLVELGDPVASSYWVEAADPDSLDVEIICQAHADTVTKERLQEIENGDELDYDEQLIVACRCTRSSDWDGGTTTEYYKIVDQKGRAAYFSENNTDDVGIYGPSGGWEGPFAELPYSQDCEEQDEAPCVSSNIVASTASRISSSPHPPASMGRTRRCQPRKRPPPTRAAHTH